MIRLRISCLPGDKDDDVSINDTDVAVSPCSDVAFEARFKTKLTTKFATNIENEFTKLPNCVLNARSS